MRINKTVKIKAPELIVDFQIQIISVKQRN